MLADFLPHAVPDLQQLILSVVFVRMGEESVAVFGIDVPK
jgi:hypothetical protein